MTFDDLIGRPPSAEDLMAVLAEAEALLLDNVRPDDPDAAQRAARRVRVGRADACAEVYRFLLGHWPEPVRGSVVVSRYLGKMGDPLRRLRELRTAMAEANVPWTLVNDDGAWTIGATS